MKKQLDITERTRENLVDAFWQLYSKKRIEKITVKEVTTLSGYNRGTFYEYFSDVYDVLEQIENSLLPTIDMLPPTTAASESEQICAIYLAITEIPRFKVKSKTASKPC